MGVGIGVLSERARIFVGLDLGRARTLRRCPLWNGRKFFPGEMDWVTYERRRPLRFRMLYLERVGRSNTPRSMISLLPGDVTSAATVHQHTLAS